MKKLETTINDLIVWGNENKEGFQDELISDGYHSFAELYEFRKMYNAALFNEWASGRMEVLNGMEKGRRYENEGECKYDVHKSWKHHDGEWCFGEEGKWFIVVAMLPTGQITNHYKKEDWGLFQIPEVEKAKYVFDNHTPSDVLQRLKDLTT